MKTKAVIAGAVVLVVLVFFAMLLVRKPPQDITVRHVKSVQSADITTMTFELKNHTAALYFFCPYEVQVRNGNVWTKLQGVDRHEFGVFSIVALRVLFTAR